MKKRKIINIIGIILIVAIFYLAGIFFPNKARIGYYVQIKDNGKMYKDGEIPRKIYLTDKKKCESSHRLNIYSKDRYCYTIGSTGWVDYNYFKPEGMYDKKITYFGKGFSFPTYSDNGQINTIYGKFSDKNIMLTDLRGQKIKYKWIGLINNGSEAGGIIRYGNDILKDSEELSLKEIKENRNKRYIFYGADILFVFALVFYNVRCHKKSTQNIDFGDEG